MLNPGDVILIKDHLFIILYLDSDGDYRMLNCFNVDPHPYDLLHFDEYIAFKEAVKMDEIDYTYIGNVSTIEQLVLKRLKNED